MLSLRQSNRRLAAPPAPSSPGGGGGGGGPSRPTPLIRTGPTPPPGVAVLARLTLKFVLTECCVERPSDTTWTMFAKVGSGRTPLTGALRLFPRNAFDPRVYA